MDMMESEIYPSLKLPEIYFGTKRVRFLYLTQTKAVRIDIAARALLEFENHGIPLFLGADVLAGITQMPKNHPRLHARYSKTGLAMKLNFSGQRIEDITNCRGVWFYSIQGLFQAVFEYHSQPIQKECLVLLRDLWLARYEDPPLPECIDVNCAGNDMVPDISDLLENQAVHGVNLVSEDTPGMLTAGTDIPVHDRSGPCSSCSHSCTLVVTQASRQTYSSPQLISTSEHSLSMVETNLDDILWRVQRHLENILEEISERLESRPMCTCTTVTPVMLKRLDTLRTVFVYCLRDLCRGSEQFEPENSFPIHLLAPYLQLVNGNPHVDTFASEFVAEKGKNVALCILSEWLGKEFHKLENAISSKVEAFKQNHIGQIENLPTPQSLVHTLFPSCMSCLLENWMGVHGTRYWSGSGRATGVNGPQAHDHNYVSTQTDLLTRDTDMTEPRDTQNHLSFVQLILEFTNNCLISGVAHVLYSRLRNGQI